MGATVNTILGIAFFVVGLAATLLMYHLWGYPYDKEKLESSAPRSLVNVHRILGYTYVGIYVVLMWQMVPRMWEYQIELPARTVVHLTLGMVIGAILILKLSIVQFFRHLEGTLIPFLGTTLMICTFLVIFLSVPFSLRESYLRNQALPSGSREESLRRVSLLLEEAGQEDAAFRSELASTRGLEAGRAVLYNQCTGCHDLRTVLAKPRAAKNWWSTVKRMAERSDLLSPISELQQWQVTAYLIAISPDLQRSVQLQRRELAKADEAHKAIERLIEHDETSPVQRPASQPQTQPDPTTEEEQTDNGQTDVERTETPTTDTPPARRQELGPPPRNYSATVAKFLYESKCSQCHALSTVTDYTYTSRESVADVLQRMVSEGFEANERELEFLEYYLTQTLVK
ncbi:MAG TPA: hypothetical protein PKD64_03180 [Pirellulaceae bacterium]|nr:hypothetical protein [Pirellulaceae bacterium]HMO91173.1 hypothetical protein [Pirellulaceae bacterium]HMP69057.1 hypothetical protein [Pirellulaceae bacterium]